ncbi:MAG: radical SAM protein, partial [Muribaculaceae bacterium]|nr:radical SAM protein [Muribaculaceae bacterium]
LPAHSTRAKKSGISYISLTTNGQLLTTGNVSLSELVKAGLKEITLSIHGTDRETYEYLMPGAKFDNFLNLVKQLAVIKNEYGKEFMIRINFTVNSLNLSNLKDNRFWELWKKNGIHPDIIQLRPVQKIGESDWNDFDPSTLKEHYDSTFGNIITRAKEKGIVIMAPTRASLDEVSTPQGATEAIIEDISYCYISPTTVYKPDFDVSKENLYTYLRRHKTGSSLLRSILSRNYSRQAKSSKKLNYKVN